MGQKKEIPSLRFPEYKDSWEYKKLGDLLKFKNGINASKEQYGSGVKFINVLDILENDYITYDRIIGSVNVDKKTIEKNSVDYGDILFQRSSETREDVGTANVYLDKNSATFGGFVIRGQKIGEYDPYFLNNLLKTTIVRKDITSKSGGSTRYNVGQEILSSVLVTFPSMSEQKRISSFLQIIDKKIRQIQRRKELLEQYKKGIKQKLFSQEIRLKNEHGYNYPDWTYKKVKDFFRVTRGQVLSMTKISTTPNNDICYPVYSSQTKDNGLSGFYNDYLFEDCITWTTDGANAGDVNFRKGKFYCTNVCGVLESREGYANICIAEILNGKTRNHVSYVGNPKLMNNIMSEIKINIPSSIEEQNKISSFLISINQKIGFIETQILNMKSLKLGLLQQMFV